MLQKIKDFFLLLQKDRKVLFGTILGVGSLLYLGFADGSAPKKGLPRSGSTKTTVGSTSAMAQREAYDDIMVRFKTDLDDAKNEMRSQKQENQDIKKTLQDMEARTATILGTMLKEQASLKEQLTDTAKQPRMMDSGASFDIPSSNNNALPAGIQNTSLSSQELESFGGEQQQVVPPPLPKQEKIAFVGAGDSVRVKLLAGVNAPTDGSPYPVVFKLIDDVVGPDGSTLPLGEARVIAAAQGSLTDSRALFRLTSINLRLPNGSRKVLKADGWIVGEDGIRGMPGILIDPIGKAIAGAGLAAGLSAAGQGIVRSNTTTVLNAQGGTTEFISGDVGQYAAGRAASGAAREWSGIIRDRLSELVPVVQVMSGRESTAVFARSITIDGLYDALEEDDSAAFSPVD